MHAFIPEPTTSSRKYCKHNANQNGLGMPSKSQSTPHYSFFLSLFLFLLSSSTTHNALIRSAQLFISSLTTPAIRVHSFSNSIDNPPHSTTQSLTTSRALPQTVAAPPGILHNHGRSFRDGPFRYCKCRRRNGLHKRRPTSDDCCLYSHSQPQTPIEYRSHVRRIAPKPAHQVFPPFSTQLPNHFRQDNGPPILTPSYTRIPPVVQRHV